MDELALLGEDGDAEVGERVAQVLLHHRAGQTLACVAIVSLSPRPLWMPERLEVHQVQPAHAARARTEATKSLLDGTQPG